MRIAPHTAATPTADDDLARLDLHEASESPVRPSTTEPPVAVLLPTQTRRADVVPPETEVVPEDVTMDSDRDVDLDGAVVFLEHPRPWADNPLDTPSLPTGVSTRLRKLAALGVRVALVQRPDGDPGRALFCSVPDHGGMVIGRELDSLDELADLDLESALRHAISSHGVPDGYTEAEPQFLVSAHSSAEQRHRGSGVAAAMMTLDPEDVWESSDLVGQPDEVSVVVLPKGLVSTGVRLADASAMIDAGWQDRVVLGRFAGRLQDDQVIRLAETVLRERLQATIDAAVEPIEAELTPIASGEADDGETTTTRVTTTWRVFPTLVNDLAFARMRPDLANEPQGTWRVVVDHTETVGNGHSDVHLSVVEIGDTEAPHAGADDLHLPPPPVSLPNPTVVGEVAALTPGRALDLGCGLGRHALWLAENGWQVTGVDNSRGRLWQMAEEASLRKVGVRAELEDLREWTPGGARFDLILVSDVHIDDVFQHTSPWLAAGGRIIVIGPATGSPVPEGAAPIDYVHLAARATGARMRVLRAGEVARSDNGHTHRDAVVVAGWPS